MATVRVLAATFVGGTLMLHFGCEGQTKPGPLKPAPTLAGAPFGQPAKKAGGGTASNASPTIAAAGAKPGEVAAVGSTSVATPGAPLTADKFTAHTPQTLTYETGKGTLIAQQEAVPTCHCAGHTWWVRYYAGDTKAPAQREVHLTIDQNGYVSEIEEIDRVDRVEVVYTPPLVLVPDKLPYKTTNQAIFHQDLQMVVHPLGDRSKTKAHGPAKNDIVYEGDETVQTGAGTYTARRLTCTITADLSAARTVDTTEQWLVDGIGVVIQRDHEETRVMGAKVRDNSSTMVLKSFEQNK